MNDKNNTSTPEQKRAIELAYLDREIESLESLERSDALLSQGLERLKTLRHQRDLTRAGGSHVSQTAGTPEPENPTPLEAGDAPEVERAPTIELTVSPGEQAAGAPQVPSNVAAAEEPTLWDLNWIVGQVVGGIANIDTSGRFRAETAVRQAIATERLAAMAEVRELRAMLDDGARGALSYVGPADRLEVAVLTRMAPLLSVPDQVAATDHADGADDGGEAASLGEDLPAPHTGLTMLDRVRHILREWTWEGKHGAVERVVFALAGGDTIWEHEEVARLMDHAEARTGGKTDGG